MISSKSSRTYSADEVVLCIAASDIDIFTDKSDKSFAICSDFANFTCKRIQKEQNDRENKKDDSEKTWM